LRVAIRWFQNSLIALKSTGSEMPILYPIDEQQQLSLITQSAEAQQIAWPCQRDPAFALDAFNQDRCCSRRNGCGHGRQVIIWHVAKAGHARLETLFDFVLTRGSNGG